MDWIDSLEQEILIQLRRPTVSYETKQFANLRLQSLRPKFEKITRENAYKDHLLRYLEAEREKFKLFKQDGETDEILEETHYDELRERPVCTCDGKRAHQCPLKRGILPREVRRAEEIDDGIREFRGGHPGNPIVLEDAQDDWAALVGEVEREMRDLLAILSSDEIPESADWPADARQNGQTAD